MAFVYISDKARDEDGDCLVYFPHLGNEAHFPTRRHCAHEVGFLRSGVRASICPLHFPAPR